MTTYLSDENLQTLHRLSVQFLDGKVPEYVKTAAEDLPTKDEPLAIFADPLRRILPCHTKSATFLSNLYFYGLQATGIPWTGAFPATKVAERLESAARIHGNIDEVTFVRERLAEKTAEAQLTDADFALVRTGKGCTVRQLPVNTADAIKRSAAQFTEQRRELPYAWRRDTAIALLEKAAERNVEIPADHLDYLVKAAGLYPLPAKQASRLVLSRANVLVDDEQRAMLRKLANDLTDTKADDYIKVAELIDEVDHADAPSACMTLDIPVAEELLFTGLQTKVAHGEEVVALATGNTFSLADLERVGLEPFDALEPYRAAMASNVLMSNGLDLQKVAEILPTMPLDDARILEVALGALGVRPLVKSAAHGSDMTGPAWAEWVREQEGRTGGAADFNFQVAVPVHYSTRLNKKAVTAGRPLSERLPMALVGAHAV